MADHNFIPGKGNNAFIHLLGKKKPEEAVRVEICRVCGRPTTDHEKHCPRGEPASDKE